jgi:molecular chaperone Hsp33
MQGILSGSLKKALSPRAEALMVAVDATNSIDELMRRQRVYPPSMYHLGQAAIAALLVQSLSDSSDEERVDFQWKLEGPFGNLVAESLASAKYRASIANVQTSEETFGQSLGSGILQVRRSNKDGRQVAAGIVESRGSVAEDLAEYLEKSEQKNCAVGLYVKVAWDESQGPDFPFKVQRAIGYLVHVLPSSSDAEQKMHLAMWDKHLKDLGPLSMWELPEDAEETTSTIFSFLTGHSQNPETYSSPVQIFCPCSESRIFQAVELLTKREKDWLIEGQDQKEHVEVSCEFCGEIYEISKNEFKKRRSPRMG